MEKVRPWCGQPADRGRLKYRTIVANEFSEKFFPGVGRGRIHNQPDHACSRNFQNASLSIYNT